MAGRVKADDKPNAEEVGLADLELDPHNTRRHSERNLALIEQSLREFGPLRSIVVDEGGRVLAGNGTVQAASVAGIQRVKVVDAEPGTLTAVRVRGLDERQKQLYGLMENQCGDTSEHDAGRIRDLHDDGLDLSSIFVEDELEALLRESDMEDEVRAGLGSGGGAGSRELPNHKGGKLVKPVLTCDQVAVFERAILATGCKNRGEAMVQICEAYLGPE